MEMTKGNTLVNLPVTALLNVSFDGRSFLLQGQGNRLTILEPSSLRCLGVCHVPVQQAIHGIVAITQQHCAVQYEVDVLVWSGCFVSRLSVIVDCSAALKASADISVLRSLQLRDWALHCEISRSQTSVYVLTSHNVIIHLDLKSDHAKCLQYRTSISPARTFLYCGTLWEHDGILIVSAGTAFGELITWQSGVGSNDRLEEPTILSFLEGHRGSIFGTSVASPPVFGGGGSQLVASCSDDRTIRLWKTPPPNLKVFTSCIPNAGDSHNNHKLCETWAHLSRIWSVQFLPSTKDQLRLLSFGEDGVLNGWTVSAQALPETSPSLDREGLRRTFNDRHHAGKNIWSHAESSFEDSTIVYTGGADGRIVTRQISWACDPPLHPRVFAQKFTDMLVCAPGAKALKMYQLNADGNVIATSDTGHIIQGLIADKNIHWRSKTTLQGVRGLQLCSNLVEDHILYYDSSSRAIYQLSKSIPDTPVCVASVEGAVSWLRILSYSTSTPLQGWMEICVMMAFFDRHEVELLWINSESESASATARTKVQLPETFIVTSASYDCATNILVCGSRAGAMVMYHNVNSLVQSVDTYLCTRHVHGSDAVTDIVFLDTAQDIEQNKDAAIVHCLTTGRDGAYAIQEIVKDSLSQRLSARTVHQATTYLGSDIEGTHVVQTGSGQQEILLYGFRSTEFVVWNETKNTQVFSIDCGGSHRSWAFQSRHAGEAGTFVWTKAGKCCVAMYDTPDHQVLQQGGHGRELKAIAVYRESDATRLIATGAEDTDIRLFRYTYGHNTSARLHNLHILRKHTTGIQHLRFSRSGSILFSSGGIEELFAWRLTKAPVISIGSAFHAALPKDDVDSDARIMSFDICESESERIIRLAVAYSNGKAKAFDYSPQVDSDQAFVQIWQVDFGALCLTQAVLFDSSASDESTSCVVFGATDGTLTRLKTVQDLVSRPSRQIHQNSIATLATVNQGEGFWTITGGDDSALAFTFLANDRDVSTSPSVQIPRAHAAAITAVTAATLGAAASQAGGELSEEIPPAGIDTIQSKHSLVISAGNDQRVKVWSLICDGVETKYESNAEFLKGVQLNPLGEWYTNVADISCIEILRIQHEKLERVRPFTVQIEVVVVGVGMESMLLNIEFLEPYLTT